MSEVWGIIYYFSDQLSQTPHTNVDYILWKNNLYTISLTFYHFLGVSSWY